MKFDTGEPFSYTTNSAAATCSFTISAATRKILVNAITVHSDLANATVKIDASGTTLWQMITGSASLTQHYPGLSIATDAEATLSGNVTGSGSATISICGKYRLI